MASASSTNTSTTASVFTMPSSWHHNRLYGIVVTSSWRPLGAYNFFPTRAALEQRAADGAHHGDDSDDDHASNGATTPAAGGGGGSGHHGGADADSGGSGGGAGGAHDGNDNGNGGGRRGGGMMKRFTNLKVCREASYMTRTTERHSHCVTLAQA